MLSPRQETVLFETVRLFVETGEPVSSSAIAGSEALEVSSATVRNVMSALEQLGLLYQPHTSAGRIPTPSGLRLYVDSLPLEAPRGQADPALGRIEDEVAGLAAADLATAARGVGGLLSELVRMTSIISLPGLSDAILEELHLSQLSQGRVLAVWVTRDDRVFHRVVHLGQPVAPEQLRRVQAYLSELGLGLTLDQVRVRVSLEMEALEREWNDTVRCALEIGRKALEAARPTVYVEGKLNVFDYAELTADMDRLKQLLAVLEEQELVLELVDGLLEEANPTVLIGPELDLDLGDDVSLIVCAYQRDQEPLGVLGVLGPARLDYGRVVPLVHYTARVLSGHLRRR